MEGIVDRFEEDKVVLEIEEGTLIFDRTLFPEGIKEGDMVKYIDNKFIVKEKETEERKQYIDNLFNSLIDDKK
ncbi:MAG: DUF3006 domain-containing protein [Tissierellia bacterium]|nr:DUF3006 domain-containing protein [Tissierellia bacterium]